MIHFRENLVVKYFKILTHLTKFYLSSCEIKKIIIVFFKKSVFETVKYFFSFQDFFLRFKWSNWRLLIKCVVHETIKKLSVTF